MVFRQVGYGYYNVPNTNDVSGNQIIFDNYEVAHFRLLTDTNFLTLW